MSRYFITFDVRLFSPCSVTHSGFAFHPFSSIADSSHTWLEHKAVDGKGNPSDAAPGHSSHKAQKPGNGKPHTKKKKGATHGGYVAAARGAAAQGVLSLHTSASAEVLEGASSLQAGRKRPRDGGGSDTGADSDLLLPVTTASEDDAVGERPATRARMS